MCELRVEVREELHGGGENFWVKAFHSFVEAVKCSGAGLDLGGVEGDKVECGHVVQRFGKLRGNHQTEEDVQI
jgi:hypothetical protein